MPGVAGSVLHDIVFKLVFGQKGCETVLRALLNALLELTGTNRVADVVILNPISERQFFTQKGTILDLRCQDEKGSRYVVELQVQGSPDHVERTLFYAADQIRSQLNPGDRYGDLPRLVIISIVDFTLFPDHKDLQSKVVLYDVEHKKQVSDRLEVHFLELKKFKKNQPAKLQSPFERWLYFLKFSSLYAEAGSEIPEALQEEEGIEMAIHTFRETLASEEVQELIRSRRMAEHDAASRLAAAEAQGLQQGLKKGRKKGLQEGLKEGLKEGLIKARVETARKMLAGGLPVEQVAQFSGLPIERVRELQESN